MKIIVDVTVDAPIATVWDAYVTPEDIIQWNAASEDWHTTQATVDLREGGRFCSRMEAKDGSFGFDFEGSYVRVVPHELIEYEFGGRHARVDFAAREQGVFVRVTFDPEDENPADMQQQGWQAILNSFKRHVEAMPQQ